MKPSSPRLQQMAPTLTAQADLLPLAPHSGPLVSVATDAGLSGREPGLLLEFPHLAEVPSPHGDWVLPSPSCTVPMLGMAGSQGWGKEGTSVGGRVSGVGSTGSCGDQEMRE